LAVTVLAASGHGFRLALGGVQNIWHALATPSGVGVVRWILVATFLWSGVAKVLQPEPAGQAARHFGVNVGSTLALGYALGFAELFIGLALAAAVNTIPSIAKAVGACATLLLASFAAGLTAQLARGRRFPCYCFGNENDEISSTTLARTLFLTLLAAFATVRSDDVGAGAHFALVTMAAGLSIVGLAVLTVPLRDLAFHLGAPSGRPQ
jgi:hypothetical protein